jgi:protein-disulfide isomerase
MTTGKKVLLGVFTALILSAGVYYLYDNRIDDAAGDIASAEEAGLTPEAASPIVENTPELKVTDIKVEVTADINASKPRILGNKNAPLTITEYASFTCPHCAQMEESVLPYLLRDYVATGKAKIILSDFPLNREAMDATLLSRCVPTESYVPFRAMVFANLETWPANHPQMLKQFAALAGLDDAKATACLNDKKTEEAIIKTMQEAGEKFNVKSTPSFVINNDPNNTIIGAVSLEQFTNALDATLAKKEGSK